MISYEGEKGFFVVFSFDIPFFSPSEVRAGDTHFVYRGNCDESCSVVQ